MDLRASLTALGHLARMPLSPLPTTLALTGAMLLAWGTVSVADIVWPRITISDSTGRVTAVRCSGTVADALRLAQVTVHPQDAISAPLNMRIPRLHRIHIRRAVPVTITTATREFELWTVAADISDLKNDPRLEMSPLDRLWPRSGTPIRPGMRIKLARVTTREDTATETLPPPVDFVHDDKLPRGASALVSAGKPGLQEVRLIHYYKDGVFSGSQKIAGAILKAAIPEVRKIGVRALSLARGARGNQMLVMEATAYEPGPVSCGPYADGYTATGVRATYGICAVDPRVIPLGTRLYVEGYGVARAEDVGGAIKGLKIDVCFDTVPEAMRWGRRKVKVWILDDIGGTTIPIINKQGEMQKLVAVSVPGTAKATPAPEPAAAIIEPEPAPEPEPEADETAPIDLLPPPIDLLPVAE